MDLISENLLISLFVSEIVKPFRLSLELTLDFFPLQHMTAMTIASVSIFCILKELECWVLQRRSKANDVFLQLSACNCSEDGSDPARNMDCDRETGQCYCKQFVTGRRCDECLDGYFALQLARTTGCTGMKPWLQMDAGLFVAWNSWSNKQQTKNS